MCPKGDLPQQYSVDGSSMHHLPAFNPKNEVRRMSSCISIEQGEPQKDLEPTEHTASPATQADVS